MARLEDIRGLAEAHASSISSSPRDWMNYLDTAPDYTDTHLWISF